MCVLELIALKCYICPRKCGAARDVKPGACGMGTLPRVARAAAHMWEEPCISGERGSGAVFFSGCSLKCVYCQNKAISAGGFGRDITAAHLREIFLRLADSGVHNINLVNPTHFAPAIAEAIGPGLPVPVVWNSGGYDSVETLKTLEGKIDIYLPDMKYSNPALGAKYSSVPDYPETARAAIGEMFRQTGPYEEDADGILRRGVVVRHLILPGSLENTFGVIDWFARTFRPGDALFSLMSQYTPMPGLEKFPELQRRLTREEYGMAIARLEASGIEDGFYQELSSADSEYIPDFDLTGV